jgi:glycine cleavage system H protein
MEFPESLKYTENHEWIRVEDELGTAGITDYAQDQLSDIVFVEITASIEEEMAQGDTFAEVESVKAAAYVYMPVEGVLTELNESLADTPELINTDPYGKAWMVKIKLTDASQLDDLMDADAYASYCEDQEN